MSATDMHSVKQQTAESRAKACAELVTGEPGEPWLVWCDTDYEADAIKSALHGVDSVVEIRGSHSPEAKESAVLGFIDGSHRVLVTKPSIAGQGLNFQHCARTAYVGRSFSYEAWYQSVRRFWRFGQKRSVECYVVVAEGEDQIGRAIERKATEHAAMKTAMREAMARDESKESQRKQAYNPTHKGELPSWLNV